MVDRQYRDQQWLAKQYYELGRSLTSIAAECGVSRSTIADWVKKLGGTRTCSISEESLRTLYGSGLSSKQIAAQLGCHHTTILRHLKQHNILMRNRAEVAAQFWADAENRAAMREAGKRAWRDEDYRRRQELARQSSHYRARASETMKRVWEDPAYRTHMEQVYESTSFRRQMAEAYSRTPRVSSLQTVLYSLLDDLGVRYYREYKDKPNDPETIIGPHCFDCVIPRLGKPGLVIECQGEYWHSRKQSTDKAKATYLANNFPTQYELKYLWEHEFNQPERIRHLLKYWLGLAQPAIVNFDFKAITLRPVSAQEYTPLLQKYHYLPNAGRGGIAYGAFWRGTLVAVVVFSPLPRQNISFDGFAPEQIRELSRLCIHPSYQKKNFASWLVARSIKLLDSQYKCIVAYADTTFNHTGSIYKAANFKYDGEVKPDYWYVTADGWAAHKKTIYNQAVRYGLVESDYARSRGYSKVRGGKKLRFVYVR